LARKIEVALGCGYDTRKKGSLQLESIKSFYWEIGTHYYSPLSKNDESRTSFISRAQNPEKGIYVIGEVVSNKQGWVEGVEGALDSVEMVLKNAL
jgi:hypothetical protein